MSEHLRTGLDEPALATGEPADLLEQRLELVPADAVEGPPEVVWEADDADTLEQAVEVGYDDEHDHDAG